MGKDEEGLIRMAKSLNRPIPDKIANQPELNGDLIFYMNAFLRLSRSRRNENGHIPYESLSLYCKDMMMDMTEREEFMSIIEHMDSSYVAYRVDKIEKKRASIENSNNKTAIKKR